MNQDFDTPIFIENEQDFLIKRKENNKNQKFSFICESCNKLVEYRFNKIKVFPHKCESCRKQKLYSDTPIQILSKNDIDRLKLEYKQTQLVSFTCPICGKTGTKPLRLISDLPILCKQCKTKQTNIERFGETSAMKCDEINKKRIATMVERHGGVGFASEDISSKIIATIKERYGVDNVMQLKDNQDKAYNTKKEKYGEDFFKENIKNAANKQYGVDNYMKVPEISKKSFNSKKDKYGENFLSENLKKSAQIQFGVDNFMKVKEIAAKSVSTQKKLYGDNYIYNRVKESMLKKYGVDNAMYVDELKEKVFDTKIKKYGSAKNFPNVIASHKRFLKKRQSEVEQLDLEWLDSDTFRGKYDGTPIYYTFKCNKCGTIFKDDFHSGFPVCRTCKPSMVGTSHQEQEVIEYIKSIYSGTVLVHDRKLLNGKELDIYLPDLKVAIEYNGTYWHGYRKDTNEPISSFKEKIEYKRKACIEKGVRLITVDEVDYTDRPDVFKRFFQDTICPRKRVFARKCKVVNVSTEDAKNFCEKYHVNGFRGGSTKIGLELDGELLVVAIFGKHSKYENECIRLCYKTGYNVIGGWERIIKHFGKPFLHYVNLKYFKGENKTGCGYRFFMKGQLFSRQQLQKKNLFKHIDNVDESVSDFTNCLNAGGIAIFDCGNDIRLYNYNNVN